MCGTQASSPNNFSSLFSCSIVFGNFWFQQNPSVWARRSLLVIPILWLISWQLTLLGECTDLSKLFLPLQIGGKRGVTSQPYSVVKSFLTSVRVRQLGFGSEFPGCKLKHRLPLLILWVSNWKVHPRLWMMRDEMQIPVSQAWGSFCDSLFLKSFRVIWLLQG